MDTPHFLYGFGYSAEIRTRGSKLACLKYLNRTLVEPFDELDPRTLYSGEILAPWPNRIGGGEYHLQGERYLLPINEPSRGNSLHGLLYGHDWQLLQKTASKISLDMTLNETKAYPFTLNFQSTLELVEEGLVWTVSATNVSSRPAPYGISIHPYLVADQSTSVDDWELLLPSREYLEVDESTLLPHSMLNCVNGNFDFSSPRKIGKDQIDHAFHIDPNTNSPIITLVGPHGSGVWMGYGSESKWIQIHTADRENAADGRKSLAVEPMTCPPNAFNSKIDLIYLTPKTPHIATWKIGAIN